MFKYLTEDYWEYFFKKVFRKGEEKIIHDGKHFEELIFLLLKKLYQNEDISWIPTQETHDGNRDFYAETPNGDILWAECKNYHATIELKNIAATIVMVQINNVSEILFFSYSPINNNTREKLTIYADQNDKKISFYDDINLENLIFNYRESILPHFFPKFKYSSEIQIDYEPYVFTKYGKGIFVSTTESKKIDILHVQLNDIIYIGIGIFNRNPAQSISINIVFSKENDLKYLELLDSDYERDDSSKYQINDVLEPMTAKFYPIFLRISVYKEIMKLPDLLLNYKIENRLNKYPISTLSVEVDHLFLTGLIGSDYYDLLDEFKNNFFSNDDIKIAYLKGKSGIGKTRMLYEYINILLKEKYQIISFMAVPQDNSSIYIIKEIVYRLYNLSEELIIESLKNPIPYANVLGDDMSKIIEMLQNIIQNNTDAITAFEPFIFEKIIQTRVAILIDNIQYFDDILIDFLIHYCLYAKNVNRPNYSIIVMCQNTDYFASSNLQQLNFILKSLSENNFTSIYINELCGFRENQALGYFKAIVNFKNDSLNNILLKLVEKANNNPKIILEMTKYLRQKKILKTENDCFIVQNYADFISELNNFPLEDNNIIERRWHTYFKDKTDGENIIILLSAVHFFGKVTISLCKKIKLSFHYLDELCSAGFLKMNLQNEYSFDHDIFESFFAKENEFASLIIEYLSNIKKININLYTWQKNLINIEKQEMLYSEMEDILRAICNNTLAVPYKWQLYYYDIITDFLLTHYEYIEDKNLLLYGLHFICLKTKNNFGTEAALKLYTIIYDNLEFKMEKGRYRCRQYLELLDGYTENLLHLGSDNIIPIYIKEIDELEKHPDLFPDILGKLYNRVYVFYKDKMKESYVHEYYLKCNSFCEKYNLHELQMLNYFDAGTYYIYQDYDLNKLTSFWDKAFAIYDREQFDDAFLFVAKKKIQVYFLTQQFGLIKNELETAQKYLNAFKNDIQQSLFFYKNFSTLYATYLLLNDADNSELPLYLSKALDYSEQMNKTTLFNIYYLYAKYYYHIKDIQNMVYYYELSLNAIEERQKCVYYEQYKTVIDEDFHLKIVSLLLQREDIQKTFNKSKLSLITYEKFKDYSAQQLDDYIAAFKTIAPVASQDSKDGYLLI